jgi:hypothetical protein
VAQEFFVDAVRDHAQQPVHIADGVEQAPPLHGTVFLLGFHLEPLGKDGQDHIGQSPCHENFPGHFTKTSDGLAFENN